MGGIRTGRAVAAALALVVLLLPGSGTAGGARAGEPRVLFVGDSLFVGVGAGAPVQVRTVASLLGWRPVLDARSGTGYTTGGRNGRPYLERLKSDGYLRHAYDTVVLEGGTNDAHHGDLAVLEERALEVVDYVHSRVPSARIVLVGAFVAHGVPRFERYVEVDRVLAGVAAERGLTYVSQLHWSEQPGILSADRFHPHAAGYRLMGREIAAALRP